MVISHKRDDPYCEKNIRRNLCSPVAAGGRGASRARHDQGTCENSCLTWLLLLPSYIIGEQCSRGDGDGLVTGGEHGPAVGTALGDVEVLARTEQIQHGQIVDAALRACREAEAG